MQEYEYDDIYVSEEQPSVEITESAQEIDVAEIDTYTIEISEAFPSFDTGENLNHALMNNRELQDQHPISAITGLREELDEIESLKVVYSNEKNQANYYLWEDGNVDKENRVGHFVTLCPADDTIKLCVESDDVFGVIVETAGFIGGQSDVEREYNYGLVAHSGAVAVRCETSVDVGDRIMSNGHGLAKKSESGYGYKVVALENIYGVDFAIINLDVPMNQMNNLMIGFDVFGDRLDEAEINMVSAMNISQEAYNKAFESAIVSEEAVKKALEAIGKADNASQGVGDMHDIVLSVSQTAAQAKAVAESAWTSAESIRDEAESVANEALSVAMSINGNVESIRADIDETLKELDALESEIEPLSTWTDGTNSGISGFVAKSDADATELSSLVRWSKGEETGEGQYNLAEIKSTVDENEAKIIQLAANDEALAARITSVDEDKASIEDVAAIGKSLADYKLEVTDTYAEIESVTKIDTDLRKSITQVEQKADTNGASIQSLVANIDKYSVGEYSQAYGLSREQAKNILQQGMVYIPTSHKDSRSHEETFVGENTSEKFTPKYYYIWNGEDWEESAAPLVAFFSEEPAPSRVLKYWYIDSDTAPEGYEPHALYIWENEQWKKVNILDGNVSNRIVSMIRQSANEISVEVVNARGDIVSLNERITPVEASVQTVATWKSAVEGDVRKIATIEQTASDASASVAMVVRKTENGKEIDTASIILAINEDGENFICADADYINFTGKTLDLVSKQFTITAKDGFKLDENGITWGADGSPLQILYSSELIEKPVNGAKYSSFPDSSTTGWHKIFVNGDKYATDTGDGGATWTNPRQIVGEDGKSVELTQENVFNALTRNGTIKGMVRDDDGELYINADYINAGTIKAENIDVAGVITAGEVYITDILNATTITANALKITNTSNSVLFNASGNSVTIGGFSVGTNSIYKDKASYSNTTEGVYIGTDGIGLGAGTFYVNSAGYLTSTSGKIGGWSLSSNGFFSSGYTNGVPTIGFGSNLGYKTNDSSQQEVVFYVGPTNSTNAQQYLLDADFMITKNSEVYAKQIHLGGNIALAHDGIIVTEDGLGSATAAFITNTGSTFNSITVNDGIDPATQHGCSLGSQNTRWSNIFTYALNVSGGVIIGTNATINGTLSVGSFNPSSITTTTLLPTGVTTTIGNSTYPWGACYIGRGYFGSNENLTNLSVTGDAYVSKIMNCETCSAAVVDAGIVYTNSGGVEASDENVKNTIVSMDDRYSDIFDDLRPVSYKFNDGESGRTHTGLIAQEVRATLDKYNVSTTDFAAYCSWEEEDGTMACGLRYTEFISMCIYEIQKLKARVAELENTVGALYN